jgi:hypothetical protein
MPTAKVIVLSILLPIMGRNSSLCILARFVLILVVPVTWICNRRLLGYTQKTLSESQELNNSLEASSASA